MMTRLVKSENSGPRATYHAAPVSDLDNAALDARGQTCRVCGNGNSSLVLEMPLALSHGRVALVLRSSSIDHHRAVHVLLNVAFEPLDWRVRSYMATLASWHPRQGILKGTPSELRCSVNVEEVDEGKNVTGTMFDVHCNTEGSRNDRRIPAINTFGETVMMLPSGCSVVCSRHVKFGANHHRVPARRATLRESGHQEASDSFVALGLTGKALPYKYGCSDRELATSFCVE